MKEKEKQIVEAAIKLFATKGFSSTSIQEIATEAGISKGAFYLYFKSKDALLLAILKFYSERMFEKIQIIEKEPLDPREKFQKQLRYLFVEIQQQKEFLIMQMREQAVPFNKDIESFVRNQRSKSHRFYYNSLKSIYGDQIEPFLWDLTLIIQGIFHSYFELIIFNMASFDFEKLAAFMLKRADDLAAGFSVSNEQPMLSEEFTKHLIDSETNRYDKEHILANIKKIRNKDEYLDENVLVTLEVIESEMEKNEPRIAVIQGMVSNLDSVKGLEDLTNQIKQFYRLK